MKLFNFLKRGSVEKGVPYSFFLNSGVMSSIITRTDALDFYKSWVYACVARRAMGIAQVDFKLYRKQGKDKVVEVFEHEALDLLYKVNSQMTKFDFLQLSIIYRDLLGASPWILEKTNPTDKYPSSMYIARPEFFKVNRDKEGNLLNYTYELGLYKKTYQPDEVIFLKNYNPKNPDKGIGLIEAVRTTAKNDDYINQTNNSLLENGARLGGYFETDDVLEGDERKKVLKNLRSKYAGYDNAYKIQLLEGGLKFKADMIAPRDLEFIEGRKLNRDEIAGVFGVPKSLLTFDDVNRASAVAGEYQFNKWTLEPLATQIVEQLNEFLIPLFGDDLWLSFEPLAKEDEEVVLKKKEASWNKWQTTNEIREQEGKEPIDGGDSIYLPLMNSLPVMGNKGVEGKDFIKIGSTKANLDYVDLKTQKYVLKRINNRNLRLKRLANKVGDDVVKSLEKSIEKKSADNKVVLKLVSEKKNGNLGLSKESIDIFYKDRMMTEEKLEIVWKEKMTKYFIDQGNKFSKKLDTLNNKKSASNDIGIDAGAEIASVVEVIEPLVFETVGVGVDQASRLVDQPAIADYGFLQDWVKTTSEKLGEQITKTTITEFDKTIREGIEAGESISELKRRTQKVFEFATDTRAEMIARTETARGITEAHRQTYEYYGFKNVDWLLSVDACPVCQERATREWTTKTIKGEIPVHPNCKCDFTPIN